MNLKLKYILTGIVLISFISCDSILFLNYRVKNTTKQKIRLQVTAYPVDQLAGMWSPRVDTIFFLEPNQSIIIGNHDGGIGFPWDNKRLFREQPGLQNFNLIIGDSIVGIDANDKYWTYSSRMSTFRIKKKHLPKNYSGLLLQECPH